MRIEKPVLTTSGATVTGFEFAGHTFDVTVKLTGVAGAVNEARDEVGRDVSEIDLVNIEKVEFFTHSHLYGDHKFGEITEVKVEHLVFSNKVDDTVAEFAQELLEAELERAIERFEEVRL